MFAPSWFYLQKIIEGCTDNKTYYCDIYVNNILKSGFQLTVNGLRLNHEEMDKGAVLRDTYCGDFSLVRRR